MTGIRQSKGSRAFAECIVSVVQIELVGSPFCIGIGPRIADIKVLPSILVNVDNGDATGPFAALLESAARGDIVELEVCGGR